MATPFIIQLTGLSGSGKSTLAAQSQIILGLCGIPAEVIDADVYRENLCSDLGFSRADRIENIRRLGDIAASLSQSRVVIIAAINPYEEARLQLKAKYDAALVWIQCDMEVLIARDTKGLYKRALLPPNHPLKLTNLTGVNDPYEVPESADIIIDSGATTVQQGASLIAGLACQRLGITKAFYTFVQMK